MVLGTGDLERMRNSLEDLLPDTCTIQSVTQTADSVGGRTAGWANTDTNVACRVARLDQRGRNEMEGDQAVVLADWVVTLHHDQAITMAQRIVLANITLEPLNINTDKSWEIGTRVLCRELATG